MQCTSGLAGCAYPITTLAASPGRLDGCESLDNEVTPAAGLSLKEMAASLGRLRPAQGVPRTHHT
ncbi:hypothetical protein BDA96_06G170200 [Sorghum bicolor]|uniref:Uncharacterized protein n=1 Tax=Sorghum bicolor TaxID=4558 RepID=A0A921UCK4_SORBI|nr:hypothetical protein BDA96_06G170200 [Sorghum bicolor]